LILGNKAWIKTNVKGAAESSGKNRPALRRIKPKRAFPFNPHIPGVQKILWWVYQKDQELIPKACQNSGNKRFCTETRRQIFQNRMDPQVYFFQRNPPCPAQCTIKSAKGAL